MGRAKSKTFYAEYPKTQVTIEQMVHCAVPSKTIKRLDILVKRITTDPNQGTGDFKRFGCDRCDVAECDGTATLGAVLLENPSTSTSIL